jgi:hypothetical protein
MLAASSASRRVDRVLGTDSSIVAVMCDACKKEVREAAKIQNCGHLPNRVGKKSRMVQPTVCLNFVKEAVEFKKDIVISPNKASKVWQSKYFFILSYRKYFIQIPCTQMCCPHNHAIINNPEFFPHIGSEACPHLKLEANDEVSWNLVEHSEHFIIVGPKLIPENETVLPSFMCPEFPSAAIPVLWDIQELGTFQLQTNGNLLRRNEQETTSWNPENYCLAMSTNYSNNKDDIYHYNITYMTCMGEMTTWCQRFSSTFRDILLCLSTIFLILTLVVYKKQNLSSPK